MDKKECYGTGGVRLWEDNVGWDTLQDGRRSISSLQGQCAARKRSTNQFWRYEYGSGPATPADIAYTPNDRARPMTNFGHFNLAFEL